MKWWTFVSLIALVFSGCVEPERDEQPGAPDESTPVNSVKSEDLGPLEWSFSINEGPGDNLEWHQEFTVGAWDVSSLRATVNDDVLVGEYQFTLTSPSGVREDILGGMGLHTPVTGTVNYGTCCGIRMDHEPGAWLLSFEGRGHVDVDVNIRLMA